ncbi:MAG: hypothetical protein L0G70_04725 [Rubrobacter sp.]|nr:hypothetical protein [Rubrobacter sp.]
MQKHVCTESRRGTSGHMIEQIRKSWRQFKKSKPGRRFQDRYHRRSDESKASRIVVLVVGVIMALVGLASMPLPIPADGFLLPLGLLFIASEIEPVARFLDWTELKARQAWRRVSTR